MTTSIEIGDTIEFYAYKPAATFISTAPEPFPADAQFVRATVLEVNSTCTGESYVTDCPRDLWPYQVKREQVIRNATTQPCTCGCE